MEFPRPTTTRKVRKFVGLVNFYHCFLPNAARILQPFHKLQGAKKSGGIELQYSSKATSAFMPVKESLASSTLLAYPKPNAPTRIMCDTSDMVVGTVLQQHVGDQWCPIVYFSKQLQPTLTRYSSLIKKSWPSTCQLSIFDTSLEVDNFRSTWITSPSPTLF